MGPSLISLSACSSSDFTPIKFEPRSHLILAAGPRIEKKRRSAQINEFESIDSKTSMWMARLLRQVKTSPHRLDLIEPPLSLRVWMIHGPNTSHPTLVNGGGVSRKRKHCRQPFGGPLLVSKAQQLFSVLHSGELFLRGSFDVFRRLLTREV